MKICSIKKNYEFKEVYNQNLSIKSDILVMYYKPTANANFSRIGICVSKKVGNSVIRSRVKRLIKENYRNKFMSLKNGYDIVFIARSVAANSSYDKIGKSMLFLLNKAKIYIK